MEVAAAHEVRSNELDVLLEALYEPAFYKVSVFVSRNGGTFDDAKDVFHDAFVIFYERHAGSDAIESPVDYLFGIARHLWYKKIKGAGLTEPLPDHCDTALSHEPSVSQNRLLNLLERAGKRCMDLLESFYLDGMGIKGLTKTFGYTDEHSASVQKYKCIEKLRTILRTKSLTYEDFLE